MIQALETGVEGKIMIYVTVDEASLMDRLNWYRKPSAVYYRKGKPIAKHWLLNPITVEKLKLGVAIEKLPPE